MVTAKSDWRTLRTTLRAASAGWANASATARTVRTANSRAMTDPVRRLECFGVDALAWVGVDKGIASF